MSGPGQNYYLWYDLESGRFSPVTWDLNLAWSAFGGRGPPGGFGGDAGAGNRFGGRGGNALKQRFLAIRRYARLTRTTEARLRAELLGPQALDDLARLRTVAARSGAIDEAVLTSEYELLRDRLAATAPRTTSP